MGLTRRARCSASTSTAPLQTALLRAAGASRSLAPATARSKASGVHPHVSRGQWRAGAGIRCSGPCSRCWRHMAPHPLGGDAGERRTRRGPAVGEPVASLRGGQTHVRPCGAEPSDSTEAHSGTRAHYPQPRVHTAAGSLDAGPHPQGHARRPPGHTARRPPPTAICRVLGSRVPRLMAARSLPPSGTLWAAAPKPYKQYSSTRTRHTQYHSTTQALR